MMDQLPKPAIIWRTSHIPNIWGPHIPGLTNICAGAASDIAPSHMVSDISPDGFRISNHYFSEMSAMWRVWKYGPRSDIVGWCQYRRYFWFGNQPILYDHLFAGIDRKFLESHMDNVVPQNLESLANNNTFSVGRRMNLGLSVYDHYCQIHKKQDYLEYFRIIAQDYPHLAPFMVDQFTQDLVYGCDMFICTWEIFDEICTMWFDSLMKFINGRNRIHEDDYQNRAPSFLSERSFTAWVQYKQSQGWQVNELPLMLLTDI